MSRLRSRVNWADPFIAHPQGMLISASLVIEYSSEPGPTAGVAVYSTRLGGSGPLAGLCADGKR